MVRGSSKVPFGGSESCKSPDCLVVVAEVLLFGRLVVVVWAASEKKGLAGGGVVGIVAGEGPVVNESLLYFQNVCSAPDICD